MSQDLLEILTGEPSTPAPKARPTGTLSLPGKSRMDPLDAMIRTVYGEAGSEEEHPWIAAVIANRARASGKDFTDVVMEPGQFEPWGDKKARARMAALSPSSPEYQTIAANIKGVLAGEDPTGGATHFYAPGAQASMGRDKPEWDDGNGVQVGKSMFFRNPGAAGGTDLEALLTGGRAAAETETPDADAAFQAAFGKAAQAGAEPETAQFTSDRGGDVPYSHGGGTISKAQQAVYEMLVKANVFDPKAAPGSKENPFYTRGNEADAEPGSYIVNDEGQLKRVPSPDDKPEGMGEKIKAGLGQGVADVAQSVGEILPGTEDSELLNRLTAKQAAYDADLKGDPMAGAARFTGQMAATIPALGVVGKGAQVVAKGAGPIGQFLVGEGGSLAKSGGALQKIIGVGSKAAAGAGEGAGASLLVSSAGEGDKADQAKTGAALGAVLGPVGSGIVKGVRRFVGGAKTAGAAPAAEQAARVAMSKGLPVEVPMSVGQVTGAPGQQLSENAMLKGVEGDAAARIMQNLADEQQGALKANTAAITEKIAGQPVERGQGGTAVAEKLNKMRDTSKAGVDAAYDAARASGDDGMLSSAKDVRESMLTAIRPHYSLENVEPVAKEIESLGKQGSPTVRELFESRARLSKIARDGDGLAPGAAKIAIKALDDYSDRALADDLILGDANSVRQWKAAISKRAEHGKLFDGDDMIEALTERAQRSGGETTKIDPADAANYIFGRGNLGFVGKRNLTRDVTRIKDVLGADSPEWNQLRGDLFQRFVRQGKGPNERGGETFSGQNFMNAWNKAKAEDAEVLKAMFTPEERKLIDDFAEVAQRVTTPVKGGDNSSNSAFAGAVLVKKALGSLGTMGGGGIGSAIGGPTGAAAGSAVGRVFDDFMKNIRSVLKAQKAISGAAPKAAGEVKNRLLPSPTKTAIITQGSQRFSGQPETVP